MVVVLPTPPFRLITASRWQPVTGVRARVTSSARRRSAGDGPRFILPPVRFSTPLRQPLCGRAFRDRRIVAAVSVSAWLVALPSGTGGMSKTGRSAAGVRTKTGGGAAASVGGRSGCLGGRLEGSTDGCRGGRCSVPGHGGVSRRVERLLARLGRRAHHRLRPGEVDDEGLGGGAEVVRRDVRGRLVPGPDSSSDEPRRLRRVVPSVEVLVEGGVVREEAVAPLGGRVLSAHGAPE